MFQLVRCLKPNKVCFNRFLYNNFQPERVDSLIVVDVSPTVSPRAKTYPAFLQMMLKIQVQLYMQQDLPVSEARKIAINMLKEVEPVSKLYQ